MDGWINGWMCEQASKEWALAGKPGVRICHQRPSMLVAALHMRNRAMVDQGGILARFSERSLRKVSSQAAGPEVFHSPRVHVGHASSLSLPLEGTDAHSAQQFRPAVVCGGPQDETLSRIWPRCYKAQLLIEGAAPNRC